MCIESMPRVMHAERTIADTVQFPFTTKRMDYFLTWRSSVEAETGTSVLVPEVVTRTALPWRSTLTQPVAGGRVIRSSRH
jgi:hypothetical protein